MVKSPILQCLCPALPTPLCVRGSAWLPRGTSQLPASQAAPPPAVKCSQPPFLTHCHHQWVLIKGEGNVLLFSSGGTGRNWRRRKQGAGGEEKGKGWAVREDGCIGSIRMVACLLSPCLFQRVQKNHKIKLLVQAAHPSCRREGGCLQNKYFVGFIQRLKPFLRQQRCLLRPSERRLSY